MNEITGLADEGLTWRLEQAAKALGGNADVTFHTFPEANHLFQKAESGSPEEYATLEKAFVDGFLDMISDWIGERFGN